MSNVKTFIEISRIGWAKRNTDTPTNEDINTGALQRIAHAIEKMSANVNSLMQERDKYKQHYEITENENGRLHRLNARYKKEIKRLKDSKK